MGTSAIEHTRLGDLTKIGKGGQGVVYHAPNLRSAFAPSLVYKQYKPQTLADINFKTLSAMPSLLTDILTGPDARCLISLAAWPCAIVETDGKPTGFVMPAIPDQFYIALKTVKGNERAVAEFQHLLNDAGFLAARGIALDDRYRLRLLRAVASSLAFLHRHRVCVGDISPRNLLFSFSSTEKVYLVDCDTMRVDGTSALPQIETPGWEAPAGEELATPYSDTYKLGLLALRLLVGDQDAKEADQLPDGTPAFLRRLISDTLVANPEKRPLPTAWVSILDRIIQDWTHTAPVFGSGSPTLPSPNGEPHATLRSRPASQSGPVAAKRSGVRATKTAKSTTPTPKASPNQGNPPSSGVSKNEALSLLILGAIVFVFVFIIVLVAVASGR